jgi:probable rRNA maturation factor
MALQREGVKEASLSFVFVTRQKISALNKKYLGRAYATDVLAFDAREKAGRARSGEALVGDIIISVDAARTNARTYGVPFSRELALYVIHGILHLLGYDDHTPRDVKRMRRKEQQLLQYTIGKAGDGRDLS